MRADSRRMRLLTAGATRQLTRREIEREVSQFSNKFTVFKYRIRSPSVKLSPQSAQLQAKRRPVSRAGVQILTFAEESRPVAASVRPHLSSLSRSVESVTYRRPQPGGFPRRRVTELHVPLQPKPAVSHDDKLPSRPALRL
ncbi:hypothetical protein BaRGS_00005468 [Batillaria attramentaria]|uniref:Uncharacterized protein n=1 Tax=Batillaria attramentaria TaxID=370345 RepID=A0ABD0LVG7_9CAEN